MTAIEKIKSLEAEFKKSGIDPIDAKWIVCEVCNKSITEISDLVLSKKQMNLINKAFKKRLKHIPLAHIFKRSNFYGLDLYVNSNVLIPRFETEGLCQLISKILPVKVLGNVYGLDLGTGSGAISIVLSKIFGYKMTAVDISYKALKVAKKSAR